METVRFIYHHEADGRWAESPEIEGWPVAGDSFSEVRELAIVGIPFALGGEAEIEHQFCPEDDRGSRDHSATTADDRELGK